MKAFFKKNLTVPNILSFIRLLLVPVYAILFFKDRMISALCVFLAASLTDFLDGYIARKYNLITDLGKLLDPLADKLMVLTSMFCLAIGTAAYPPVIPWAAVIILLCKEGLMILGGMFMLRKKIVVASVMAGKAAHCVFLAALIAGHFHPFWVRLCPGWFMTPDVMLVWLAVILTLYALYVYASRCLKALKRGQW